MTLARIGRLHLFDTFAAPIQIVDQVRYEITKPVNDPGGQVAAWLRQMGNRIAIMETNVGVGFQTRRSRDPRTPGGNLGEIAVDEYATHLALTASPTFVPLVLFEDPDILETRIARLPRVHLLNTVAWIRALSDERRDCGRGAGAGGHQRGAEIADGAPGAPWPHQPVSSRAG